MNRLFVVVVLYRQRWQESPLLPVLEDFCKNGQGSLLVYDNSPAAQEDPFFLTEGVYYLHNDKNPGLATAYNKAIQLAGTTHDRLLLLDQDTLLSKAYLDEVICWDMSEDVPVIVPRLFAGDRQVSPLMAAEYIGRNSLPLAPGVYHERLMAVNSGCGISLAYLKETGGFNESFPLDFLDHWFFFRLFTAGKGVRVSPKAMQHELSVLDYRNVTPQRYQSILSGEYLFYTKYDSACSKRHQKQLFLRMIKQFITVKDRRIWKLTQQAYLKLRRSPD